MTRQRCRLLDTQLLGHHHAEIAKRIDITATTIFHIMTVDGLSDLDLSAPRRSAAPGTRSRWAPRPGSGKPGGARLHLTDPVIARLPGPDHPPGGYTPLRHRVPVAATC
jgi:hypothetical protein